MAALTMSACDEAALGATDEDATGRADRGAPDAGNPDGSAPVGAPTAAAGADVELVVGEPMRLDGSSSRDRDGRIVDWSWDLGNGDVRQGRSIAYTYTTAGTYIVTLTVTDDDGLTDHDDLTATVHPRGDELAIGIDGPASVVRGVESVWSAAATDEDAVDRWVWSTGVPEVEAREGPQLMYAYPEHGTFPLALTAEVEGDEDHTATLDVTVLAPPVAVIAAPSTTTAEAEIELRGDDSFDPDDGSIVEYRWSFDDGTEATGPVQRHRFAEPGDYDVVLEVVDDDGLDGRATAKVIVTAQDNAAPVAVASADPASVELGTPVVLDGTASTDDHDRIASYAWQTGTGVDLTGPTASFTYGAAGTYIATLVVTDDGGLSDSDTVSVEVRPPNSRPRAVIRGPFEAVAGEQSTWDGRESEDPDGEIVSWAWSVDAAATTEGVDASVLRATFPTWGRQEIGLTVTDDAGDEDDAVQSVDVLARPVAVIDGGFVGEVGAALSFDGRPSHDPDDGTIVDYAWDWGDGTSSTGPIRSHVWEAPGEYDVVLTVTDDDGLEGDVSAKVTIAPRANIPPTATLDADRFGVLTYEAIDFRSSRSFDEDGTIAGVLWDFGDGTTTTVANPTHEWEDDGTYVVELLVSDDDGATDRAIANVTVSNRPPVASFETDRRIALGDTAIFDATDSSDLDGEVVRYRWDFGDDVVSAGSPRPTTTHAYDAEGIYRVVLTVTDDDGADHSTETLIEVGESSVGGGDYDGTWVLSEPVDFTCAFGVVVVNFGSFRIDDARPNIVLVPAGGDPGEMTGMFDGETAFEVSNRQSGICTEEYRVVGEFLDDNTLEGTFSGNFTGECFDCTAFSIPIRATR